MITKTVGSLSIPLQADFDFAFLADYGEPFAVFPMQDSGNLCFGVERDGQRRFLKVAGAPTVRSLVSPEEAVARLTSTIPVYEALAHPLLAGLLRHHAIAGGYLFVMEWFEGTCMGKQYGAFDRFLRMPLPDKLRLYDGILAFHEHVHARGYVAIDFYDGSILYSFETGQVKLCDIEFYRKKPVVNTMGRMWGSSRYMSPEEHLLGATIDEQSNVFCMGATAFQLMGGGMDRSLTRWDAPPALHAVANRAVAERREDRYPSIKAYRAAWARAVAHSF